MLGSRRVTAQIDASQNPIDQKRILTKYFHHLLRHYHKGLISRHEVLAAIAGFSQVPTLKLSNIDHPIASLIYCAMQLELPPHYRRSNITWDDFEEMIATLNYENEHNDWFCIKYDAKALPNENGNCSLCGAKLVSISKNPGELREVQIYLEEKATENFKKDSSGEDITTWLNEDEADVYRNIANA